MREKMRIAARRELISRIGPRYRAAAVSEKTRILDEFRAVTGYSRKHAIHVLNRSPTEKQTDRKRSPVYDREVREALIDVWHASNRLCSKRLAPFLPELVEALERHGRLILKPAIKRKLLAMSAATMDRLLKSHRRLTGPSLTRSGPLLKKSVPVRTFADWNDVSPGFLEADLVAHCGDTVSGLYLQTLVLTDIYSGWVEPYCLLHKREKDVLAAIEDIRELLPFHLVGLDTDNGSEFINHGLIDYCAKHEITFTRSRPYKKNDQCHVEEKNGSVVRRTVGYNRYEGAIAQDAFNRLYAVLRLFVNFFQPSMKLIYKERREARVTKKYQAAKTPYRRLLDSNQLSQQEKEKLTETYLQLDPHELLYTIEKLQDDLLTHSTFYQKTSEAATAAKEIEAASQPPGERQRRHRKARKRKGGCAGKPGSVNTAASVAHENIERIVGEGPSWRAKRIAMEQLLLVSWED